ncbi:MAG: hypothetical protein AABY88_02450 [Pseudomonadota bacterium]
MNSNQTLAEVKQGQQRRAVERHLANQPPKPRSLFARAGRAIKYAAAGAGAIVLGTFIWGLISPIGIAGVMIAFLAMLGAMCAGVFFSRERLVPFEKLREVDLKRLPQSTDRWLQAQRRALPAPAITLVNDIGRKLDTLGMQLQTIDEREPIAGELRRLIGDELPELVNGYNRVPPHLRRDGLNGMSPDKQLVDGLGVVDTELTRLSEQLASGDLNTLATQGRYLELKYQGDSTS